MNIRANAGHLTISSDTISTRLTILSYKSEMPPVSSSVANLGITSQEDVQP